MILPAGTLALFALARITRASMLAVLGAEIHPHRPRQ